MMTHIMAPPSFWQDYLKRSLATCPVVTEPALRENEKVRSSIIVIAHPIDAHGRKCTPGFQLNEILAAIPFAKKIGIDLAYDAPWVIGDLDRAIELGGHQALDQPGSQNLCRSVGSQAGLRFPPIA